MPSDREACSMLVIERCRVLNRKLAEQQAGIGVTLDDIAIAAIYSAVDVAQVQAGDPRAAIAWARRALDVMDAHLAGAGETRQ